MPNNTINCDVVVPQNVQFGEFANAFRIEATGSGAECFLDFCVYSAENNVAKVVARVRVHSTFLHIMQERLGAALRDISGDEPKPEFVLAEGVLRNAENQVVLFEATTTDQ